ncbi:hypothetical protein KPH14_012778 [Odynerus spinipes]|uniref:PiggyBac transposable element-derived protein domain-containing protein n=1 Tax=Odynerus spinipes TaxID=1348599 RepID=A0AAD9RDJ7_9HYME|nr:hypothetical protein KPH14_012778 [Odynerus spinipes]
MPRIRNRIISDSESASEDGDLPLSELWKKIKNQRKWNIPSATESFEPQVFGYIDAHNGVQYTSGISENSSPLSIFKFFFCEELIQLIVEESNKFSKKQGFSKSYFHVSAQDLHCIFAIIIHMSIVHLPKLSMYWNTTPMYNFVLIRQITSKRKFFRILRFLYFIGEDQNNNDNVKIQKIQPVIDILVHRFQNAYRPRRHIVVDESLLLWKGRLSFKQYINTKSARFGLKSFILAESETGYVYNLKLYDGRISNDGQCSLLGKSGSIVLNLSRNLLNEGRIIYLDNWYTSPALFEKLYKYKTHVCGTVRVNRKGLPCDEKVKKIKNLNKGEIVVRYNKFMAFCAWMDKRPVTLLSTFHTPQSVTTNKIDYSTGQQIKEPNLVVDYNMHMGAVDHTDQILHGKPLEGFVDADWANCPNDRKSYTGFAFILAGYPISWEARKQRTVALSSTEAEYMALSEAAKEATYLRRLFAELGLAKLGQVKIFCDNNGARKLAENPIFHNRSKHIDIRDHYVREVLENGEIEIVYAPTAEMAADVLTAETRLVSGSSRHGEDRSFGILSS